MQCKDTSYTCKVSCKCFRLQKGGCQVRSRSAYGDIDSSEARERCMLGWESFPEGRKWES